MNNFANLQHINIIDKHIDDTFNINDYISSSDYISLIKIDNIPAVRL